MLCISFLHLSFFLVLLLQLLNMVSIVLSVIQIFFGFISMRDEFGSCMIPWRGGFKLLDVVVASSVFFQAELVMRVAILATHWACLCEGIKLYAATHAARLVTPEWFPKARAPCARAPEAREQLPSSPGTVSAQ